MQNKEEKTDIHIEIYIASLVMKRLGKMLNRAKTVHIYILQQSNTIIVTERYYVQLYYQRQQVRQQHAKVFTPRQANSSNHVSHYLVKPVFFNSRRENLNQILVIIESHNQVIFLRIRCSSSLPIFESFNQRWSNLNQTRNVYEQIKHPKTCFENILLLLISLNNIIINRKNQPISSNLTQTISRKHS